jgi:hypothetical protein
VTDVALLPDVVDDAGVESAGVAGIVEVPTLLVVGKTPIVGTAAAELTPRLPISVEPSGIPVRAVPPGTVGEVDVGVDEDATLLEPEPHIPDNPDVCSIPDVADIPDIDEVPDIAVESPVAGVVLPTVIPPPSKLEVDPNIPVGEVPNVEQAVPLIVPVAVIVLVVGAGLTPGEAISVAPSGIPVPPTDVVGPIPSGEVASSEGVAGIVPIWAKAGLNPETDRMNAIMTACFIGTFLNCIAWRLTRRAGRAAP